MINLSMMTEWFATLINELFATPADSTESGRSSLKTVKILDHSAGQRG